MKIVADASAFKKSVELLRPGSTKNRFTSPADYSVKIEARGKGVLELTTCSIDHWESVKVLGQDVQEPGAVLVPWTVFRKVMGVLKDEQVTVTSDNIETVIASGTTKITIPVPKDVDGSTSTAPGIPARPQDAMPIRLHLGAIAEVARVAAFDWARPILSTVYYDRGSYVATDSYRLFKVDVPEHAEDTTFLIPRPIFEALGRIGSPKFVDAWVSRDQWNGGNLWVDLGDASVCGKLQEGEFPNYKNLLPDYRDKGLKIDSGVRMAVTRVAQLVSAVSRDSWQETSAVEVSEEDGAVVMFSKVGDITVEVKFVGSMDIPAGFNPQYLQDFFHGTNVNSMFGDTSLKPWGLEEEADYCSGSRRLRLLMPVRVSSSFGRG